MNIFKQFIESFYSFEKYPIFMQTKGFKVFIYIFMLSLISMISMFFLKLPDIISYNKIGGTQGIVDKYIDNFDIKDGKLTTNKIEYKSKNKNFIISVDTTKDNLDISLADGYLLGVLADSEKVILINSTASAVIKYSELGENFNKDSLVSMLNLIFKLSILFTVLAYFILRFVEILIFSAMGMLINSIVGAKITFMQMYKLTAYCQTMPIVLSSILLIFGVVMPFIIYTGVVFTYIYIALKNVKAQNGVIIAVL